MSEKEPLYDSPGERGKRGAEQALNGFMSYVRRQRAGSKEYGDKAIQEDEAGYDLATFEDEGVNQQD